MVEEEILTRGGIYLIKLNPSKPSEVGKIRPSIILTSQKILNSKPPVVFICPLSSQSKPMFKNIHLKIEKRDGLNVHSYALVEHCRTVSISRINYPRIAQSTDLELITIIEKLNYLLT